LPTTLIKRAELRVTASMATSGAEQLTAKRQNLSQRQKMNFGRFIFRDFELHGKSKSALDFRDSSSDRTKTPIVNFCRNDPDKF